MRKTCRILILAAVLALLTACGSGRSIEDICGFRTEDLDSIHLLRGGELVPQHIMEESCTHVLGYTFDASDVRIEPLLNEMRVGIVQEITIGDPDGKFDFLQYAGGYTFDRIELITKTDVHFELLFQPEEPEYVLIRAKDKETQVALIKSEVFTPRFIAETLDCVEKGK